MIYTVLLESEEAMFRIITLSYFLRSKLCFSLPIDAMIVMHAEWFSRYQAFRTRFANAVLDKHVRPPFLFESTIWHVIETFIGLLNSNSIHWA